MSTFKREQGKLMGKGYSKESAGRILGAAAQKAKNPSPAQQRVLKAQKGKPVAKKTSAPKTVSAPRTTR